ncbi:phosphodiesterase [Fusobacterium sp.]|uniref:phosphodiesterase n=1 Tax=Fusobacterium sp. TaxID=68766 RepID=UPI0025BF8B22|nr:phosphodiesterase [Fusobacterium sp.]
MKLFIISDIHGSLYYLEKVMEIFKKGDYDKLVILGDELYHGPRNPLPKDYSPKDVIQILNGYKDKIIAVRGNCDSEVDQMVLDYPIMSDYALLYLGEKRVYITHGHIYNKENPLPMSEGDILLYGHFHIPMIEKIENRYFFNPGSISLPKNSSKNSFAILDEETFTIKDLDENIIMDIKF